MAEIKDGFKNNEQEQEEAEIVNLDGEPFIIIGELEHEGDIFLALIPYEEEDENSDEEEVEFVILKEAEENGEYFLATIDDEGIYKQIGEMFLEFFEKEMEEFTDEE